jgi:serine/threonine protein kinase
VLKLEERVNIPEIDGYSGEKYSNFTFFKKGGMGEIYKGVETKTVKEVVLKLVLIGTDEEKKLLETEIHVSEKLTHPNISKTLKTGQIEVEGSSYLYIVQEYYPNGNMRFVLRENIPFEECLSLMVDILSGMKEIHKVIVHRDLKPENILVDLNGHLLLTDFGLAKYIDEKTRTRSFKGYGTVPYMAPECWAGDTNTISMDIYSLGLIFYEIVTGHLPSDAKTELEWREFHLFTSLPSIASFRPGISIKFNQIVQKMTNKRPSDRYKTIDEVLSAINEAALINVAETTEAERLARMGNVVLQAMKAEQLKAAHEKEKSDEWIKFLNFQITELFSSIIEKANAVNERLEDGKIKIAEQKNHQGSTARTLKVSFGGKAISFGFADSTALEQYESEIKSRSLDFQRQKYGMVMQAPSETFLRANKVVLVGIAETNFKVGTSEFGFNLILRKTDDSNYGEWYIMQFSRNVTPAETSFGLDLSIFFSEYEKVKSSMFHTTTFRKLNDSDILSLLEKVF